MHKLLLAAITFVAMAFSGCGSDNVSCSDKGKCSQDTAPTAADISSCQAALASACGSQYQAILNCALSNEKCDASGNMDLTATETACSSQLANFVTCCTTNPTAAACSAAP
jgi:hypothetical protein